MKVLVTGVNGQLGYDVMNELNQRGHEAIGSDITESKEHFQKYVQLDITNKEAVELEITKINQVLIALNDRFFIGNDVCADSFYALLLFKYSVQNTWQ